mmetsp:Transcript_33835/g.89699  ORF Transcript_33835/g.89699 Transcript_33835/m.89699 type:complete len:110 (-) Transcript_33835:1466-1795(-)
MTQGRPVSYKGRPDSKFKPIRVSQQTTCGAKGPAKRGLSFGGGGGGRADGRAQASIIEVVEEDFPIILLTLPCSLKYGYGLCARAGCIDCVIASMTSSLGGSTFLMKSL